MRQYRKNISSRKGWEATASYCLVVACDTWEQYCVLLLYTEAGFNFSFCGCMCDYLI